MLKFVHYRGQATTCCQQQAVDWAVDKMNEVNRGHSFNKRFSATFFCLQAAGAILPLLTNCLTLFRYKLVLLYWGYCNILLRPGKESSWGFFQFCNILLFYQCFIGINLLKAKIFHCYLTALWGWGGKEKGSACRQGSRIEPWIEHKERFQAPQLCFCGCSSDFNTSTRLTPCSLAEYIHTSSSWTKHIEGKRWNKIFALISLKALVSE